MNFNDWLFFNKIKFIQKESIYIIPSFGKIMIIPSKEGIIIDSDFCLNVSSEEMKISKKEEIDFFVFQFGNEFFYTERSKLQINEFKNFSYVGEMDCETTKFLNLGVRGEYESLNGAFTYDLWVEKANFIYSKNDKKALAICEKNTLAGTLSFQIECNKKKIKSIIGETISIRKNDIVSDLKIFVKNAKGWNNILKINKKINVDNEKREIEENDFFLLSEGLICVLSLNHYIHEGDFEKILKIYEKHFGQDFFIQIDSSNYLNEEVNLKNLKKIQKVFHFKNCKPIFIQDSFYLESWDFEIKKYLNSVSKINQFESNNQFLKHSDDVLTFFEPYSNSNFNDFLNVAFENTFVLSDSCDFQINTGSHKLPKYEHDFNLSNKELFDSIIEDGLNKKCINLSNFENYRKRIEIENEVITNAGFIDYFLILWDIVTWAKKNDILVGTGRGSVGGSLIAYCMDITDIDPIKHDLLFERFLNKTRVSGERAKAADALPDIDIDFESNRRDDVKKYMEQRWGMNHVVSVGTYTRLKLRSSIKDLGRVEGLTFDYVNHITSYIPNRQEDWDWIDLFKFAILHKDVKDFVQKNHKLVMLIKKCMFQTRSASIHPSAVVITPKKDELGNEMTVFDWMPIKKIDGELVCEWEGKYIDKAGFLKEDILGLSQLDKFKMILNLIEKNNNYKINFNEIKLNDKKVFNLFKKGYNEDVFQFGTSGISNFCRDLQPSNVEELTAINALYRPGPMKSNAHKDFVDIKFGNKKPNYDFGLKEVTETTYGLYVYQEQIMKAVNVLGNLTLSEADEVRTVMKKFDKAKMQTFKEKFVIGALSNGCKEEEAIKIWDKLERFSSYGFNKSHSAAYSLIGYFCQWLKVHYPLEFWTTALNFSNDEPNIITNLLNEINLVSDDIEIMPPDINFSTEIFIDDFKNKKIYWSLLKIKGIGIAKVSDILQARINGKFYSIEEFLKRTKKISKKDCETLILAGAFDNVYELEKQGDRFSLLKELKELYLKDYTIPNDFKNNNDSIFLIAQKKLTGFGDVDFKIILNKSDLPNDLKKLYKEPSLFEKQKINSDILILGRLMSYKIRQSKNGDFINLYLDCNNHIIQAVLWNDVYQNHIGQFLKLKNKLIAIDGIVKYDTFKKSNVLYSKKATKIYLI